MKKGYMLVNIEFIEDMLFLPELNMHIESIEMTDDGVKINIYRDDDNIKKLDLASSIRFFSKDI